MELVQVRVSDLQPHPRQDEFFSSLSHVMLEALAEDIECRGQQEPIRILRDGTIVAGHQRVEVFRRRGWAEIDAYVVDEEEELADEAVVDDLVSDNWMRRQLDDLTLARCYARFRQRYDCEYADESGDMRDILAARLGCGKSGRTLDRLLKLLELPRDIQDLITARSLTKSQGHTLLRLPPKDREAAYGRLREGDSAKSVLAAYKEDCGAAAKQPCEIAQELLRSLSQHQDVLESHLQELDTVQLPGRDVLAVLDQSIHLLTSIRDRKILLHEQSMQQIHNQIA